MRHTIHLLLLLPLLLLSACAQISVEDPEPHRITLHIGGYTMTPFDRATTRSGETADAAGVSHIDLALFADDGTKVIKLNQHLGDADFGAPSITISEGHYTLVVIAHSGTGVATITSTSEVTFPNNKVTDTFYVCREVTVDAATSSLDVTLQRAVAMVRVVLTDNQLPADFAQLKLYYTGGSSTFNPTTGFGSKDSRQTEYRTISPLSNPTEWKAEIYTFPHDVEDKLKITLTPQDAQGADLPNTGKVLEEMPVRINYITEVRGVLFNSAVTTFKQPFLLNFNTAWSGSYTIDF